MDGFEDTPIGFGTWRLTDRKSCIEAVRTALETGYRHIDTAQNYDNEAYVGAAIAQSDVAREDVFLATKVGKSRLGYSDVLESTRRSLDRLGVDHIDLLYIHWPTVSYEPERTLPAFDELHDEGTIRHVGLSNFEPDQLNEAREILDAPIFAHQVELHPLLPQETLREYAHRHNHHVVAYSPLARGELFDRPEVQTVAEKHDVTPAQVTLAWHIAHDITPIPKASGDHIRENWAARDCALDQEDVALLDGIDDRKRLVDPVEAPWNR